MSKRTTSFTAPPAPSYELGEIHGGEWETGVIISDATFENATFTASPWAITLAETVVILLLGIIAGALVLLVYHADRQGLAVERIEAAVVGGVNAAGGTCKGVAE